MMSIFHKVSTVVMAVLLLAACASVEESAPATTYDGLQLVPSKYATVYLKPGVDFSVYDKFGVTECKVAFRKNWLRDQNTNRIDFSSRVTQQDVDRIKTQLGELCEARFRKALAADPPYTLVDEFNAGESVLILRPAIINLDINAPDVRSTSMTRSYTTSSGEMTLYLELLDATTEEVLARIIDRQRDYDKSYMTWSNSVTNRAEAERMLDRWAKKLREALDKVRAPA
jgi:Protein of unknown function (DUF3313)